MAAASQIYTRYVPISTVYVEESLAGKRVRPKDAASTIALLERPSYRRRIENLRDVGSSEVRSRFDRICHLVTDVGMLLLTEARAGDDYSLAATESLPSVRSHDVCCNCSTYLESCDEETSSLFSSVSEEDDSFAEFYDPSYRSCMVREAHAFTVHSGLENSSDKAIHIELFLEPVRAFIEKDYEEPFAAEHFHVLLGELPSDIEMTMSRAFALDRLDPSHAGKNGSFRVTTDEGCLAIFKPKEHELGYRRCESEKPMRYIRTKEGIEPGEGAFSEFLACELQGALGYGRIPYTCYVQASSAALHPDKAYRIFREGAVQCFVGGAVSFADLTNEQKASLDKREVEMLALLDLYLFNTDRTAENLLVKPESGALVPIDHGCILPRNADSGGVFCWSDLAQVEEPMSEEVGKLISELSIEPLTKILASCEAKGFSGLRKAFTERILTQETSILLLKIGAEMGLSLHEMALFYQDSLPRKNPIRKILRNAKEHAASGGVLMESVFSQIKGMLSSYVGCRELLRVEGEVTELACIQKAALELVINTHNLVSY